MKNLALLLLMGLLVGACATPPSGRQLDELPLHDELFAPQHVAVDEVLSLSDAMRLYLRREVLSRARTKGPRTGLIEALYTRSQLKLTYDASTTRTAAEAFEARAGNCLSLVLMTAAFARELGLEVQYNDVLIEPSWSRSDGIEFANGHVNLTLGGRLADKGHSLEMVNLTVDFLPQADLRGQRSRPIGERTVIAMYLNNRAAEMLAQDRRDEAYGFARAAVQYEPRYLAARNTLAVIYRRHGHPRLAEQTLRQVLALEPANVSALGNLAHALAAQGKDEEARAVREALARIQPQPPFYFLDQGLAALKRGEPAQAKQLFQQQIERASDYHEAHFWLGVANLQLGNLEEARAELHAAWENSVTNDERQLYAAKLKRAKALR
jgi:Tfp pilus assembly protein PilF